MKRQQNFDLNTGRKRGDMLNRTDIRRECNKNSYTRGEDLYIRKAVQDLAWEKKKEDGLLYYHLNLFH